MVQFWKTPSDLREFIQQSKSTLSEWSFRIVPRCLKITLTHWHDCDENGSFQRAHSLFIWGFKGVVIILDLRGISTRLVTVGHSAKSPKSSVLTPNWILILFYLICFVNIHHHVPSLRHFWRSRFFIKKKTVRKTTKHIGKRHNSSCGHRGVWLLNACKSKLPETLLESRLCFFRFFWNKSKLKYGPFYSKLISFFNSSKWFLIKVEFIRMTTTANYLLNKILLSSVWNYSQNRMNQFLQNHIWLPVSRRMKSWK